MGNTPVDPKRHLPAGSTDNSSSQTETMQKKESNDNDTDNDKIRTSSKRNRRPPEKFVARPSRQGVGCYEGDLAFLNDDYLSSSPNRSRKKKKNINRDNGSNGKNDKNDIMTGKNESSKNSNDGKEASNIAKKRKSTTENILECPSKKKRKVVESNITSDVNNGISVRTSARSRRYVFIIIN